MAAPKTLADRASAPLDPALTVGGRVRALRRAAGLTQAELAGERFSKEYVSQVELGKTRPSAAALAYLAERLDVDALELAGESVDVSRAACEAAIARAEAALDAHRHMEVLEGLETLLPAVRRTGDRRLAARLGLARGWALHHVGRLQEALAVLAEAREAAEAAGGATLEQAQALYRLGVVRFKQGSLTTALALLEEALRTCEASGRPSDALRARIWGARAKVRRRQKDFTAAAEDVQQALELATSLSDDRVLAETYLDASLVAERRHEYDLAREYAERSRAFYERIADQEYVGKLLNNLGQLRVVTGDPHEAVGLLRESFRIAVEQDNRVDAAFAASSLASARLHAGDAPGAIESAARALELLGGREEYRQEEGNARLVMGRGHMAGGALDEATRCFDAAAECFSAVGSISHVAGAWMALGDVATQRDDAALAAALYRRAAEALQDVRW
jgi:tetratricopeptide (TPR) repeat protein